MCAKEGWMGRVLLLGWIITTLGFLLGIGFYRGEVFSGESDALCVSFSIDVSRFEMYRELTAGALDELSKSLQSQGHQGKLVFGFLIFLTTIPPLPLYSTLIVLSGYTFGVWEGFVISYLASLTGAIVVFAFSRTILRDVITRW
jgi:heme exporter protein D